MSTGRHGVIKIEHLEEYCQFDEIIDVRTPAEFAEDHIPGSINCPVLDNEQRIEIGTLYTQVSPFEAKKLGAAYVAENIAHHLRQTFLVRPKNWRPLIVCWRGGERSGAMTHILRRIGWNAHQLEGGYKTYRRQVLARLEDFPARFRFIVICGATGSGKSRVLQALMQPAQVLADEVDAVAVGDLAIGGAKLLLTFDAHAVFRNKTARVAVVITQISNNIVNTWLVNFPATVRVHFTPRHFVIIKQPLRHKSSPLSLF